MKYLNIGLILLTFLVIGFSAGAQVQKYWDIAYIFFNSSSLLAFVILMIFIRRWVTKDKTRIYTEDEYEAKGKVEEFDFEKDKP